MFEVYRMEDFNEDVIPYLGSAYYRLQSFASSA
jgi:hypothetical protein